MTLRGRAMYWSMKLFSMLVGTLQKTLEDIRWATISEFRNPQSKSQCITKIKEIKQAPAETVWDFDQWFKTLMAKVSF